MNSVEDAERTWTSIDEQKRKKVWVYRRSLSSNKREKNQVSMRLVFVGKFASLVSGHFDETEHASNFGIIRSSFAA